MSGLIQEEYGSFAKDIKNLSYILRDNEFFCLNQYKIFNNQTQSLFVKCQKVQRNGKIKLIYYMEEYENISDILKEIDKSDCYKICENLISAILEIKDNGFLDVCNVCFLQALFGKSCKVFLENVASPNWRKLQSLGWQLSCQPHSHCRPYLVVTV